MSSTTPSPANALTVCEVKTRAVRVPLTFALGTSAAIVNAVPLLLVDVYMERGDRRALLSFLLRGLRREGGGGAHP